MELALIGLQNAGKTSLVNVVATGGFDTDMIPTVGFNMRKVTKGAVTIKLWDLGGQPRFRSMWERYCRGVNCIVYVVDAADHANVEVAKNELEDLLAKPTVAGVPLLVLGNKSDLPDAYSTNELIEKMDLKAIENREVCCYIISCKKQHNIDITLQCVEQGTRWWEASGLTERGGSRSQVAHEARCMRGRRGREAAWGRGRRRRDGRIGATRVKAVDLSQLSHSGRMGPRASSGTSGW